jgi:hypothetical protein
MGTDKEIPSVRAAVIEPFAHVAPTGEGWAEGLEDLGWSVERRKPGGGVAGDVDLVVTFDVPDGPLVWGYRPGSAKHVAVVSDTPHFDIEKAVPYVDLFVSHTLRFDELDARFAAAGASLRHLPFGARKFFFTCAQRQALYDVAFIGSFWHGDRGGLKYLSPFTQNGARTFFAGCMGKPAIPYLDTARIYEKTRVGLNFHYPHQKQPDRLELNGRTFDLALAGCFQLSDQPEANDLRLAAFSTEEDWEASVRSWLSRDEDRKIMAQGFRETAYAAHRWKHRMETMLEWLP